MPTVKVDAHELSKVKVEFISLVHRPANRLPIRIMKGDTAVLDLDNYNRKVDAVRATKAEAVSKASQAISDATLLLVQAGYKVIAAAGQGDGRADDGDAVDADPVTADNGTNPVGPVKNASGVSATTGATRLDDGSPNEFSPDKPSLSIGTTGKIANTSGVSDGATPGDALIADVPYSTQGSPVAKAEGGKKKLKQPAGKPGADGLDKNAGFNGPPVVAPEVPASDVPVAKAATQPVTGTTDTDAEDDDLDDPENPVTADDDEETPDANQAAVTTPSVAKSKAKKSDTDQLSQILAGMASMNQQFAAINSTVQKMDAGLTALGAEVTSVSSRVKKTDKALSALVPGQARDDHETRVEKSDTKSYPLIDTAYKNRL
jgi:hypothetical protein